MGLFENKKEDVWLLIDESYDNNYTSVGVVCIQGEVNLNLVKDMVRKMSLDPAINTMISSGAYHYAELSIGARQAVNQWVSKMPISSYIAISKEQISAIKSDKDVVAYGNLFKNIAVPLLGKFENRLGENTKIHFLFENLSDKHTIDQYFFENILQNCTSQSLDIHVVTKQTEPLIFLPDFFLGYVRDRLTKNADITWPSDSLQILSKKIGLVLCTDKDGVMERYVRGDSVSKFLS